MIDRVAGINTANKGSAGLLWNRIREKSVDEQCRGGEDTDTVVTCSYTSL